MRNALPLKRCASLLLSTAALSAGLILCAPSYSALAQSEEPKAIAPEEAIDLLGPDQWQALVPHLDPRKSLAENREEAWSMGDNSVARVSGKGWGYLRTPEAYRDYHLVLEYQWAEHTWGDRADKARDSGVLFHLHGPDGGAGGGSWMNGFEAQLLEGGTGNLAALRFPVRGQEPPETSMTAKVTPAGGVPVWAKDGTSATYPEGRATVAKVYGSGYDSAWQDERGFRAKNDLQNPLGEWNRLEVICRGDTVRILLNGEAVNEASAVTPAAGYVALQSEGAEVLVRRWELWPLDQFKEEWKPVESSTDTGYSPTGDSLLPRREPWPAEESIKHWHIDGDFEMQLVASEPLITDPVDVVWDEAGRMFVAEMRDYPLPADHGPLMSRIRLLKDTNGDGQMDEAVTWADNLDHVQGLLPMQGGLLATTRTSILFLKDTDNDGSADEKTVLFESNEPRHSQLQISCPRWGLDNAIYLNNGLDGKEIYPEGNPEAKVTFTSLNLRYDPRTKEMSPVSGRGQFGATLDDWGRRFFCTNRNPAMMAVLPLEAVRRNPVAGITQGYEDIAPEAAKVYPLLLTHTTADAHAGTHTAACGLGIYRGGAMPELKGDLFVCEPTAQMVTRSHLVPNGASLKAERVGEGKDFLVSDDEWSRPVHVRNGPDGNFYVCDMYRRFIDHARFFPEEYSKTNYMRAGFDQGRIYRLVKKGAQPPAGGWAPDLSGKSTEDLVALLDHANSWQRLTAQRLLMERNAKDAVLALKKLVENATTPQGKVHAMWALDGLGSLDLATVRMLMNDETSEVVENALKAAKLRFGGDEGLVAELIELTKHEHGRVRLEAVLGLAGAAGPEVVPALTGVLLANPEDPWLRKGVLSSAEGKEGALALAVVGNAEFLKSAAEGKVDLLTELASAASARGNLPELAALLGKLNAAGVTGSWWQYATLEGFSEGLRRSPLKQKSLGALISSPPEELKDSIAPVKEILDSAKTLAGDRSKPVADRLAALPLVQQQGMEDVLPLVDQLISQQEPVEIQKAACQTLTRYDRVKVAEFFFERWKTLAPTPRREALALITGNNNSAKLLMEKMKAGEISPSLMDPMSRWKFARSTNEELKALALELFGQAAGDRGKVIDDYTASLKLEASKERGRDVFVKGACITCHKAGDQGVEVGPSLADVRIKPGAALLTDILDPNRMVEERWAAYLVELKDGRSLVGLVASETADTVVMKMPGGITESIPRSEVTKMETTGVSLMPVGLEGAISKQDMADLIAFLKAG